MLELPDLPRFGPYVLTRALGAWSLGFRVLALHRADQSSHVLYTVDRTVSPDRVAGVRALLTSASDLLHPHLLRIESFQIDQTGTIRLITPFTGDVDGVLTLERLLRSKNGRMSAFEAERVMVQVLEAMTAAHLGGRFHGALTTEQILVDRHGSICLELFGVEQSLAASGVIEGVPVNSGSREQVRDEVRTVVEIGYRLITGLRPEAPLIPAARLVRRLDPAWQSWLEKGLDPSAGFETAAEALMDLRSSSTLDRVVTRPVASVLSRMKPAGR